MQTGTFAGGNLTMMILPALAVAANVLMLPIGPNRVVLAEPGYTNLANGRATEVSAIAKAAAPVKFLLFGESHDNKNHKEALAGIIRALTAEGRTVIVGLEMFTRPNQKNLNPWSMGYWSDEQFQTEADWKNQWGFDYSIYKPLFDVVKELRLPMVALNVPRDWVRAVTRRTYEDLPDDIKGQVPPIDRSNANHKMVFDALMGDHPPTASQPDMYGAQVYWDTAMADSALKAMKHWTDSSDRIMVILAGSGHVIYGQGINYRLYQQGGMASISVIGLDGDTPTKVRASIGNFTLMR